MERKCELRAAFISLCFWVWMHCAQLLHAPATMLSLLWCLHSQSVIENKLFLPYVAFERHFVTALRGVIRNKNWYQETGLWSRWILSRVSRIFTGGMWKCLKHWARKALVGKQSLDIWKTRIQRETWAVEDGSMSFQRRHRLYWELGRVIHGIVYQRIWLYFFICPDGLS